jgi:hypothetical protein
MSAPRRKNGPAPERKILFGTRNPIARRKEIALISRAKLSIEDRLCRFGAGGDTGGVARGFAGARAFSMRLFKSS